MPRFLFLLCLLFLTNTARAAEDREVSIPADSSGPRISARLWTPGAATGKRLPLILISHGMYGDVFSHRDTAEFLADAGFAVVTLDHPQDSVSSSRDTVDNISSFLVRPVDIKRAIGFLSGSSQAVVDIDSRRIGFFGFSRGGYTGLVLAGAIPEFQAAPFPCPEEFLMCRQIRENDIPDHEAGYEPRIKAFVIADPVSFFPDRSSLRKVTAKIQLWSSEHGGMGVRPEDVASVKKNLPGSPEFHRPANSGHLSFNAPCSDESIVCADPPGFDRAEFHRKFNSEVLEFFRKNLPGDADRH
jgi:predicted dienelactone hydrolase